MRNVRRITVICALSSVIIDFALFFSPLAVGQTKPTEAAPEQQQPMPLQLPKKVIIDGWWDIDFAKEVCRTQKTCGLTEDQIERKVIAFERDFVMAAFAKAPACHGVTVALDLAAYNGKYGYHLITDRNAGLLSFSPDIDHLPTKIGDAEVIAAGQHWQMTMPHSAEVYEGDGALEQIAGDVCTIVADSSFSDLGAKPVPTTDCPKYQIPEGYQVPDGYMRGEDTHGKFWDIPKKNVDEAKKRDPHLMLRGDGPEGNSWNVVAYTSNPPRWTVIRTDHKKHNQFRYILSCDYSTWRNEQPNHNDCNLPVGATMIPDALFSPVLDIWEVDLAGERRLNINMKCFQQRFVILNETVEALGSK